MRRTQHRNICGVPAYAVLILSVSALIALSGCKREPKVAPAKPSPIYVADGSMIVRTNSNSTFALNTLTITGGTACSLTDPNGNQQITLSAPWTITSNDGHGTISTMDGKTIAATITADKLPDDGTNGPGAEFGKKALVFSPAKLNNNGASYTINCKPKACTISYAASCS